MYDLVIIILILVVILFLSKKNTSQGFDNPEDGSNPYIFGVNIKSVCDDVKKNGSKQELTECEKEKIKSCPPEKSLETQLFEQKQKYNELKLQVEDKSPKFRFSNSDRYVFDNIGLDGDDVFTQKMFDMGKKPQEAIMNRSMWSKNSMLPFLEEELNMHENSIWWDDDALEAES